MSPAPTRKEAAAKPRESRPLMTREPLTQERERKPTAASRKKRKQAPPSTPVLSFDAKYRHVPCGLQDPPSTPIFSRPSPSEPFTGSYDEQQMGPYADRDIPGPFHDGHDVPKHCRLFSEHTSTELPYTEVNDMSSAPEMYDSPVSYTSSSSPASSDQSPSEIPQVHAPLPSLYSYDTYVHQPPTVHQPYIYPMDSTPERHAQSFPSQHFDSPYSRAVLHGGPGYPENNAYSSHYSHK